MYHHVALVQGNPIVVETASFTISIKSNDNITTNNNNITTTNNNINNINNNITITCNDNTMISLL